jgi:single-stranded DNA-binding protein
MNISATGRIANLRESMTQTGTRMARGHLLVLVPAHKRQPHTYWLGIVAFGSNANSLLMFGNGRSVWLEGEARFNEWTDRNGSQREGLGVVVSAVRPS